MFRGITHWAASALLAQGNGPGGLSMDKGAPLAQDLYTSSTLALAEEHQIEFDPRLPLN